MIYLIYLWCSQLVYATHLADIDWMSPHLLWLAQSLEVSRLEVISHIFRCQLVLSVYSISPCFLHFASRRAWHYSGTTGSVFKTVTGVVSLLPSWSCLSFKTCSLMVIRPDIKQLVNTNSYFKARIWAAISILNIQSYFHTVNDWGCYDTCVRRDKVWSTYHRICQISAHWGQTLKFNFIK